MITSLFRQADKSSRCFPNIANRVSGFTDVDKHGYPRSLVEYLDSINKSPEASYCKQQVIKLLAPKTGERILDVGCGIGHIAHMVAEKVGPRGRVIGIDSSSTMIAEAKKRVGGRRANINFLVGNAEQLDFEDNTFDGCFIISTLMHVKRPQAVLSEILRVLKPGCRVAIMEGDWQTMVMTAGSQGAGEKIVKTLQSCIQNSGIGHQIVPIMKSIGFNHLAVTAGTLIATDYATANTAWRIEASMQQARKARILAQVQINILLKQMKTADEEGLFFAAATGFLIAGRKSADNRSKTSLTGRDGNGTKKERWQHNRKSGVSDRQEHKSKRYAQI